MAHCGSNSQIALAVVILGLVIDDGFSTWLKTLPRPKNIYHADQIKPFMPKN